MLPESCSINVHTFLSLIWVNFESKRKKKPSALHRHWHAKSEGCFFLFFIFFLLLLLPFIFSSFLPFPPLFIMSNLAINGELTRGQDVRTQNGNNQLISYHLIALHYVIRSILLFLFSRVRQLPSICSSSSSFSPSIPCCSFYSSLYSLSFH